MHTLKKKYLAYEFLKVCSSFTETGRLMAWYYIAFDTVKQFFRIKGTETLKELVILIKIHRCSIDFKQKQKIMFRIFLCLPKSLGFVNKMCKILENTSK